MLHISVFIFVYRVMSGNPDTLTQFRSYLIPVCDVVKCNVVFRGFHDLPPFSYRAFIFTFVFESNRK